MKNKALSKFLTIEEEVNSIISSLQKETITEEEMVSYLKRKDAKFAFYAILKINDLSEKALMDLVDKIAEEGNLYDIVDILKYLRNKNCDANILNKLISASIAENVFYNEKSPDWAVILLHFPEIDYEEIERALSYLLDNNMVSNKLYKNSIIMINEILFQQDAGVEYFEYDVELAKEFQKNVKEIKKSNLFTIRQKPFIEDVQLFAKKPTRKEIIKLLEGEGFNYIKSKNKVKAKVLE